MTLKHIATCAIAAALIVPTAATAESGTDDAPKTKTEHASKGKAKAKGHAKAKQAVFRGLVVSVDAVAGSLVVKVDGANRWARRFKGQDVAFTTATLKKVHVADVNADGKRDLADVKPGDRVHVHARITREAVAPFAARKLGDKGAPKPATAS